MRAVGTEDQPESDGDMVPEWFNVRGLVSTSSRPRNDTKMKPREEKEMSSAKEAKEV